MRPSLFDHAPLPRSPLPRLRLREIWNHCCGYHATDVQACKTIRQGRHLIFAAGDSSAEGNPRGTGHYPYQWNLMAVSWRRHALERRPGNWGSRYYRQHRSTFMSYLAILSLLGSFDSCSVRSLRRDLRSRVKHWTADFQGAASVQYDWNYLLAITGLGFWMPRRQEACLDGRASQLLISRLQLPPI